MSSFGYSYAHRPKKPRKSLFGWSQVPNRRPPRNYGWSLISASGRNTPHTTPHPTNTGSGSGSGSGSSGSDSFYPFYDPYTDLLSQLARQREADILGLRQDLTGREGAIKKLYADQIPLIEANYSQAENEAKSVNDAVANRLGIEGSQGQAALQSQLALINAAPGATQQAMGGTGAYYSGLAGANYAMDSGDVQRLIGRSAEEKTYATKQPGIIASQLESQYASDISDLMKSYAEQEFGLKQSEGESRSQYEKDKFAYEQDIKDKKEAAKQSAEALYWDNYWKKRDEAEKRWEVQQTLGQKAAADKTKAEIAAMDRQSKIDIANIRAGATVDSATIHAEATTTAATTRAGATGRGAHTTNVNQSRAYQAALNAIVDPKTGNIRKGVNAGGYNAELTMQRAINDTLRGMGIDPFSKQGNAIRRSVMAQANNRNFSSNPSARFHYDPNWAKKLKKHKKVKRPH